MARNNKKILLIIPYGSVGGMERLALNFYNHLKDKGDKVSVLKLIKLKTDIIGFGGDELALSEIDFSDMSKSKRLAFYLLAPLKIRNIIRSYKFDYSISFGDMSNFFSSLTFTKEFKVGSIHALKSVELKNPTLFNWITKLGYKYTYGRLNKLVCISKAIETDLIRKCGYKFNNIQVIYNPHNIDRIEILSLEEIESSEENALFDKKTILFLGRLSIQKSPWHLINAFSIVMEKNKDLNLVFIGDGDRAVESYLKKQIDSLKLNNNVFFLGRKTNPYKYLKKSRLLALSSNYEGTPNVIVESIIVGTPVVTTLCTEGILEIMTLGKGIRQGSNLIVESGIITPNIYKGVLEIPKKSYFEKEVAHLAQGIENVLVDDKYEARLGQNRSALLSKFDLNRVIESYLFKTTGDD